MGTYVAHIYKHPRGSRLMDVCSTWLFAYNEIISWYVLVKEECDGLTCCILFSAVNCGWSFIVMLQKHIQNLKFLTRSSFLVSFYPILIACFTIYSNFLLYKLLFFLANSKIYIGKEEKNEKRGQPHKKTRANHQKAKTELHRKKGAELYKKITFACY